MKNNFIKQTAIYTAAIAVSLGAASCSKLDEKVFGSKTIAAASTDGRFFVSFVVVAFLDGPFLSVTFLLVEDVVPLDFTDDE